MASLVLVISLLFGAPTSQAIPIPPGTVPLVLESGAAATFTMLSYGVLTELWGDARVMLQNPEDYARAGDPQRLLLGFFGLTQLTEPEKRVLAHMVDNMVQILLADHQKRNEFVSRTFAVHAPDGTFVMKVLMTMGGTVVAIIAVPGAPGSLIFRSDLRSVFYQVFYRKILFWILWRSFISTIRRIFVKICNVARRRQPASRLLWIGGSKPLISW